VPVGVSRASLLLRSLLSTVDRYFGRLRPLLRLLPKRYYVARFDSLSQYSLSAV